MRYLPLVWSAVARRPARAILTLLSMTMAFLLVGMMLGFNGFFQRLEQIARENCIYVGARFDGATTVAVGRRIAAMPEVTDITGYAVMQGYHQDVRNRVFVIMGDARVRYLVPSVPATPAQWDALRRTRTGVILSQERATFLNKKVGDTLTIVSPRTTRTDGAHSWTFQVVGIAGEALDYPAGYMFGNYEYYDESLPLSDRGKINEFDLLVSDPARVADVAQKIELMFANSSTPVSANPEKLLYRAGNAAGGVDVAGVTRNIALAGLFMILFLNANSISQSVRERFAELATLRTMGFSNVLVATLVFAEAAFPCVIGALLGLGLAAIFPHVLPILLPNEGMPPPYMTVSVYLWGAAGAAAVAMASAALPVLKLSRMDIAATLSGH